jgi:hypothetical protein
VSDQQTSATGSHLRADIPDHITLKAFRRCRDTRAAGLGDKLARTKHHSIIIMFRNSCVSVLIASFACAVVMGVRGDGGGLVVTFNSTDGVGANASVVYNGQHVVAGPPRLGGMHSPNLPDNWNTMQWGLKCNVTVDPVTHTTTLSHHWGEWTVTPVVAGSTIRFDIVVTSHVRRSHARATHCAQPHDVCATHRHQLSLEMPHGLHMYSQNYTHMHAPHENLLATTLTHH